MRAALAGIRVVDLTSVVLGPLCTQILSDLGAEVVKVESPEGDSTRYIGAARHPGMSSMFLNLNRGKRSLAIDLKRAEGRAAMMALLRRADVFVHSMRAAAIERLGLGWAAARAVNPRLIYCIASGYGAAGPHAGKPAYDDVIQAMSGLAVLQGRGAAPDYCASVVADKVTGLTAVYAILAALLARERGGQGALVEVPMFETMAGFVLAEHIGGHAFDPPLGPASYARITTPYRRPYRTADGYIAVIVYTDRQWRGFLELIGRPELFDDPRFASFTARTEHVDYLYSFIERTLATRPSAEWLAALAARDIPATPVMSTDELFADPHLAAVDFFERQAHPSEGDLRLPRNPVRFDEAAPADSRPAPCLGEHSVAVLNEAGLAMGEIESLVKAGVVVDGARR